MRTKILMTEIRSHYENATDGFSINLEYGMLFTTKVFCVICLHKAQQIYQNLYCTIALQRTNMCVCSIATAYFKFKLLII